MIHHLSIRITTTLFILLSLHPLTAAVQIDNPYNDIDWATIGRYKANFHTHTKRSDGKLDPATVIDAYHDNNYAILAITDHNRSTWPWTDDDRDPEKLGMLAVQGNEFSSGHHRNALFSAIAGDPGGDVLTTVRTAIADGALVQINHPGRYTKSPKGKGKGKGKGTTPQWYVDLFAKDRAIFALEVFNQGDRYPHDRELWDDILTLSMPARPIWGTSNDDMHRRKHMFRNYNVILAPANNETDVRAALSKGAFYFSYDPGGSGAPTAPAITAIRIDGDSITITADGATAVAWIADGETVATQMSVDIAPLLATEAVRGYIRAQITGPNGITCTQPFGIRAQ